MLTRGWEEKKTTKERGFYLLTYAQTKLLGRLNIDKCWMLGRFEEQKFRLI